MVDQSITCTQYTGHLKVNIMGFVSLILTMYTTASQTLPTSEVTYIQYATTVVYTGLVF